MSENEHKEYPLKKRSEDLPAKSPNMADFELDAYRVYRSIMGQEPSETEHASSGTSLRDLLYVLFRHKWKIAIVFLIFSSATVYYIASGSSMYKSEAKVFIRGDRNSTTLDPTAQGNSFIRSDGGAGVQMRAEMALLGSVTVAEKAVEIFGVDNILNSLPPSTETSSQKKGFWAWMDRALYMPSQWMSSAKSWVSSSLHMTQPVLTSRDKAVQSIIGNLEIEATSGGSNVLSVMYSANTPERAKAILDAILDAYLQTHILTHKSSVSPSFFKDKANEIKARLTEKEMAYDKRKKELNITSVQTEKELLLNQLNAVEARLNETQAEFGASQAGSAVLKKTISGTHTESALPAPAEMNIDPAFARIRDQLVQLKLQEMDMRTKYTSNYRPLVDTRNQIKQLEKMISDQNTNTTGTATRIQAVDPVRQGLMLQLETQRALMESLAAREKHLQAELDKLQTKLRDLTRHEQELDTMQREVAVLENEYKQYLNSVQASEISDSLDRNKVGNVSVIQTATKPTSTVRTQKKALALLIFGIFMGFASAIGLAFIIDFLDHSIKTSEDIEKNLGLPVLAALPSTRSPKPLLQEEEIA